MQNRRVAVRAIILHDGKLLCARLKKQKGPHIDEGQDYWCVPGGGVHVGEPLVPALERELIEETGVKPVVGNLLYVQQFEHKGWEHMEFFFQVLNVEDYLHIDLEQTTHGALEITEIEFIDPASKNLLPTFLKTEDLEAHIAAGIPKVFNNFGEYNA